MTGVCWAELAAPGQPLGPLLPWGGLSPGQRQLLERIQPIQAPVLGFETSRQGRWRRADLALLVLSQQWTRWARLLQPWLAEGRWLAPDLEVAAIADVLHLDHCRPETWLELCGPLPRGQSPPLMLFKNPHPPLTLPQARDLCLALAISQQTSLTGLPIEPIDDGWWDGAAALGLQHVHQIGIDLRPRPLQWRLLLGAAAGSQQHLQGLDLPQPWQDELPLWPHQIALIGGQSWSRLGLEILPRYRSSQDLGDLRAAPPIGPKQWPDFVWREGLLSQARRQQLDAMAAACEGVIHDGLTLLSGVNHLKLTIAKGTLHDIKAYAGGLAQGRRGASPKAANPELALEQALAQHWHQHRDEPWEGFQLNPGRSDRWVAAAVLALLANRRESPNLKQPWWRRCEQLLHALRPLAPIGYSQRTPADADSTIWLQRLLIESGEPANGELQQFIGSHWSESGLSTYRPGSGIARFINRPITQCQGWFEPHDCVLANLSALPGPLQNAALTLLRRRVQAGTFQSYWWPAPGWSLALVPRGTLPLQAVIDLVDQPLATPVSTGLGPALGQRLWQMQRAVALLRHGNAALRQQSCVALLGLIQGNAGLAQLACLQIPDPGTPLKAASEWDCNSGLEGSLNIDQHGHFSAALISSALQPASPARLIPE